MNDEGSKRTDAATRRKGDLAQDLEREEDVWIAPGRSYPVWSPSRAFTAADALLEVLQDEKGGS